MTNLKEIDTSVFRKEIDYYFANNLTKKTANTLGNMLAIDYAHRLDQTIDLKEHIDECIGRLKKFLGLKFIADDSFATALELFTIAITKLSYDNKNLSEERKQQAIIDSFISVYFSESSIEDFKKIKLILKNLMMGLNTKEALNYIEAEQKLLKSVIDIALKNHEKQAEINNYVKDSLIPLLSKNINLQIKIQDIKKLVAISTMAFGVVGVIALSTITSGLALPMLMLPASILSMKFAPRFSEKITQVILDTSSWIKSEKHSSNKLKANLVNFINKSNNVIKWHEKTVNFDLSQINSEQLDLVKNLSIKTKKPTDHRSMLNKQKVKDSTKDRSL